MKKDQNWFKDWFNSSYYHLLYEHRDFAEAETFINRLIEHLSISEDQKVMDLACGKGRHSIFLNKKGLDVTGLDLSKESIVQAKNFENSRLKFHVADMRSFNLDIQFDAIFNLFTSFGYFKTEKENQIVLDNIQAHLQTGGKLVIDYLNSSKTIKGLPNQENIKKQQLNFCINKFIEDGFIIKDIQFEAEGQTFHFKEYVRIMDLSTFHSILGNAGLTITHVFGDYNLGAYDEDLSDRLIIVAEKL